MTAPLDNSKNGAASEQATQATRSAPRRDVRQPEFVRFVVLIAKRFVEDNCLNLASSLTYTTLLSLIPLVTIALTLISAFPVFEQFTQGVDEFFAQNVLPPAVAKTVTAYINQFTESAGKLTAVGVVFLAVTAIMLMLTIEQAFNTIWRVKRRRPLVFRILTYWAMLTVGPLLIGLSITMTSYLVSMSLGFAKQIPGAGTLLLRLVPMLLAAAAFTLLYFVVPNRPIMFRHALIGGFAAAAMFEVMKRGFALYIAKFPTYTLVYGAFATVPIFLIWVYLSWVVALLGAIITSLLPSRRAWREPGVLHTNAVFRDALEILRVLVLAQRASRTPRTREIFAEAGVTYEVGERLLDEMAAAGWVARVVGERWALACDANLVTVADVYRRLVFAAASGAGTRQAPIDDIMQRANASVGHALALPIRTLAEDAAAADQSRRAS